MKRLSPEYVLQQYKEKDAFALAGTYLTVRTKQSPDNPIDAKSIVCGCVVGVCFATKEEISSFDNQPTPSELEARAETNGYTDAYIEGIENGFDGHAPTLYYGSYGREYNAGHEDGVASFKTLCDAGLVCPV